ncbi:MAG: fused response regulator/phosphatase [bacterium]
MSGTTHAPGGRPLALVVDDNPIWRTLVSQMVQAYGLEVVAASTSAQAIALFERQPVDFVLMDAVLPDADGFETTRRIKALAGNRFVPVLFLTSLSDDRDLVRAIEAGADDFVSKPCTPAVLKAKVSAMLRIRDIHATLDAQRAEVTSLHRQLQEQVTLAESIFARILDHGRLDSPAVRHWRSAISSVSGDLILAAARPSGGLMVMLGDFTGHGLSAAVAAVPTAHVFFSAVTGDASPQELVREINREMHVLLPSNLFCAAAIAALDAEHRCLQVWNGGLPDVLVTRAAGGVRHRFPSRHLALGILDPSDFDDSLDAIEVDARDRVFLVSDGLVEASNATGEEFGVDRLEAAIVDGAPFDLALVRAQEAVKAFLGEHRQHDDIALLEVSCDRALLDWTTGSRAGHMRGAA